MWLFLIIAISLVVLIAFLPIRITAEYSDTGFEAYLRILFFKMKLPPQKDDKEKKDKDKKKDKKKRPGRVKDLLAFIEPLFKTFGKLIRMITVRKLVANITIATDDAFLTAVAYGSAAAVVNALFPFVDRNIRIKKKYVTVNADFEANETVVYAYADVSLFSMQVIILALYFIYQYIKKEKKRGNEKNG